MARPRIIHNLSNLLKNPNPQTNAILTAWLQYLLQHGHQAVEKQLSIPIRDLDGQEYQINVDREFFFRASRHYQPAIHGQTLPLNLTRIEILSEKALGKGAFGEVKPIEYSLKLGKQNDRAAITKIKEQHNKVVKKQIFRNNREKSTWVKEGQLTRQAYGAASKGRKVHQVSTGKVGYTTQPKWLGYDGHTILYDHRKLRADHRQPLFQNPQDPNKMILAHNVCDALSVVHRNGIIHRDFKPANMIINPDTLEVNVVDFGLGLYTQQPVSGIAGTFRYFAPEYLSAWENRQGSICYTTKGDSFALGLVIAEIYGVRPTLWSDYPQLIIDMIQHGRRTDSAMIQEMYSQMAQRICAQIREPVVRQLVANLLSTNPRQRLEPADAARYLRNYMQDPQAIQQLQVMPQQQVMRRPQAVREPQAMPQQQRRMRQPQVIRQPVPAQPPAQNMQVGNNRQGFFPNHNLNRERGRFERGNHVPHFPNHNRY